MRRLHEGRHPNQIDQPQACQSFRALDRGEAISSLHPCGRRLLHQVRSGSQRVYPLVHKASSLKRKNHQLKNPVQQKDQPESGLHGSKTVRAVFIFQTKQERKFNMNNITMPVRELKTALTGLNKVISKRTSLPVLQHVRIERLAD